MKHHRSPTQSYPHNIPSQTIYATLALRHTPTSFPTLLSPLRQIANTSILGEDDFIDDFQSNACGYAPSYRSPLVGLGIAYTRDEPAASSDFQYHEHPFDSEDSVTRMQVDGEQGLLSILAKTLGVELPPAGPTVRSESLVTNEYGQMSRFSPNLIHPMSPDGRVELGLDNDLDPPPKAAIGLIPDVNMYDKLWNTNIPHASVNPLDTICAATSHDSGAFGADLPPCIFEDYSMKNLDDVGPGIGTKVEKSPSPRVIQDIMSVLIRSPSGLLFLPSPSPRLPSSRSGVPSKPAMTGPPPFVTAERAQVPDDVSIPYSPAPGSLSIADSVHSSPVLNAHLGIELSDLISKAERFRNRNPDQDIDRAWLSHFAGKLSERGELLADFRCYIIGCQQRNKRRDHILVHVGAHIGRRPFACSVCPLRFLRKNECKRHEASHSGFRPYSCDICGQTFVRQDLVKRHIKRTHERKDERLGSKRERKRSRLQ